MYQELEFTQEELFAKVWATPVLRLAKEIGVSDVALGKACRRAAIPLPTRRHWAITEARRPASPKLPPAPPDYTGVVRFTVLDADHKPQPGVWKSQSQPGSAAACCCSRAARTCGTIGIWRIQLPQLDLLRRWHAAGRSDDALPHALVATLNGIAAGVQNTG